MGHRRNPTNWEYANITAFTLLDRGYTGHEHLEEFALINMNGRLYDPVLGRMLSPDPYVQMPDFSQNFNRYSYCLNNPLKYIDLSGNFWMMPMLIGAAVGAGLGLYIVHGIAKQHNGNIDVTSMQVLVLLTRLYCQSDSYSGKRFLNIFKQFVLFIWLKDVLKYF
jgi:RHS repeat-associated protein